MKRTPTQILARAALSAAVLALLAVPVFASGDVATAIEGTWDRRSEPGENSSK